MGRQGESLTGEVVRKGMPHLRRSVIEMMTETRSR
jgi:hypothetical protein